MESRRQISTNIVYISMQSSKISTKEELKMAKQKVKESNYGNEEIMEYFSKQVAASSPVNNNKVSITNSYGFVKQDLDFE